MLLDDDESENDEQYDSESHEDCDFSENNLPTLILDLSKNSYARLRALELLGDNAVEYISRLAIMYQMSGTSILEKFLYDCCKCDSLSGILRLECAKHLLQFEFLEECSDSEDDEDAVVEKTRQNKITNDMNIQKQNLAYTALDYICANMRDTPTPSRVKAIELLMCSESHRENSRTYYCNFISNETIDSVFRYNSILALEHNDSISDVAFFTHSAFKVFFTTSTNDIYYRILAGQFLLQNNDPDSADVAEKMYQIAANTDTEYNRRADTADILLKYGSDKIQALAGDVIKELASVDGPVRTIFENAQNVHTSEVSDSVNEAIEYLVQMPLESEKKKPLTFEYVKTQIMSILDGMEANPSRDADVKIALNRILIDRSLYSNHNMSLVNILLKVWLYLSQHEHRAALETRLVEELCEISGRCSSGFAACLVNVLSGFGDFSIRISWENQIIANYMGRLNARAQTITDADSPWRSTYLENVIELWLKREQKILTYLYKRIRQENELPEDCKKLNTSELIYSKNLSVMKLIIKAFLSDQPEETNIKIEHCIEEFANNVIIEMAEKSNRWFSRQNFLFFFKATMLNIREELYEEFKEFISDTDFDLYFRRALMVYEGYQT